MIFTFQINVAEFLTYKTSVPTIYDIEVEHVNGTVTALNINPCVLRNISNIDGLLDHIDAAAKNNWESLGRKTA